MNPACFKFSGTESACLPLSVSAPPAHFPYSESLSKIIATLQEPFYSSLCMRKETMAEEAAGTSAVARRNRRKHLQNFR